MSVTLRQGIQKFYDDSSRLWEQTWGEHMHHGYYGPTGTHKLPRDRAQVALMEELLQVAKLSQPPTTILDAGCGIGGSTLFLAERFGARAVGLTLSPFQAERARERAAEAGLDARFEVADAQATGFAEGSFDLVWSLESGEHMPDKTKFLQECYRLLAPGGTFIFATWCHRPTTGSLAGPLTPAERDHLQQIYDVYYLPYVISLPEYGAIARACGFENLHSEDWSEAVAPFWDEVIASAFEPGVLAGVLRSGPHTIRGALALGLMQSGYRRGLVRFGVLWARKPV